MRLEMSQLTPYETNEDPLVLDDIISGSKAAYCLINANRRTFIYFKPDEFKNEKPRCDFILTGKDNPGFITRFIELKGTDKRRRRLGSASEWDHAFHQLFCTFMSSDLHINRQAGSVKFILCTSVSKDESRVSLRYTGYAWYRELRESLNTQVTILYRDEADLP
jgi:hypothetical protein